MLEELRESFQAMLEEKGERLILDEYLPKNGTYRLLFLTESGYWIGDTLEIQYDRKEGKIAGSESKYYDLICYLDYWSKLIDMNKPVDSKKVIHSNQYLSFFVKKDSISGEKLTDEVINGYFDVLKSPEKKYKKGKTRELYGSVKELCWKDRFLTGLIFLKKITVSCFLSGKMKIKRELFINRKGFDICFPICITAMILTESRMEKFWDFPITIWG